MKRILNLIWILSIVTLKNTVAQNYVCRNYDWAEVKSVQELTAEEKKEPSVVLKDLRFSEYIYDNNGDLELYYTRHRLIHIVEQKSLDESNKIYIGVSSPNDVVTFKARTISLAGKIQEMYKGDMKLVTEDGSQYMILAVEGLEIGGELEYFFTLKSDVNYFGTEYLQGGDFIRKESLKVISPENLVFASKSYNGLAAAKDTLIEHKRYLEVTAENVMPLPDEKYSIDNANRMRLEYKLSENNATNAHHLFSWQDAGRRYYDVTHRFEDEKKAISKFLDKLKLKGKSQEEQVKALENYIKTEFNIQSTGEEESMSKLFSKRYASKTTITSLYILALEQLEIPHELVITSDRFHIPFDESFETWNYLDDMLIYFPGLNKYMDPTSYFHRLGAIPFQNTAEKGLYIKKMTIGDASNGITTVRYIPVTGMDVNYDRMEANITISPDWKTANMKTNREMGGYEDNNLRAAYFYAAEDKKEELVKSIFSGWFGEEMKATNTSVANFNMSSDEVNKPFIMNGDIDVSSLIEKAGDNYLFSVGEVIGKQVEMYQDHQRVQPIEIGYPHKYFRKIIFQVPEGYTVKGLDKLNINYVFKNDKENDMGFVSSYTLEGQTLTINGEEYYNDLYMPISEFENFKKVVNAAADFNKIKLILAKK